MSEDELRKALSKYVSRKKEPDEEISADTLLRKLIDGALSAQDTREVVSKSDIACKLQKLFDSYREAQTFAPGDLVEWKEGLKNRRYPSYGEPVIVVEVYDEPIYVDNDSGSQYFREPLNIKLGWVDKDGEFAVFHYDSSRFRKIPKDRD